MRRYVFILILLISIQSVLICETSLVNRQEDIEQLIQEFLQHEQQLMDFSASINDYFGRGLGWYNPEFGQYGFHTRNYEPYFSENLAGFNIYDQGLVIGYFSSYYEKERDTFFLTYDPPGSRILTAGLKNGEINLLIITLEDSLSVEYWPPGNIRIVYGDDNLYLNYLYYNAEPVLTLSPMLAEAVFLNRQTELNYLPILEGIFSDFPKPYFSRILKDLLVSPVDRYNYQDTAVFATNWFRRCADIPEVTGNIQLARAAQNHAAYNINTGKISRMLSWDAAEINLDDYLSLHDEQPGLKGFTGKTPVERTEYTGYGSNSSECANLSRTDAIADTIAWFHTIFHRRPYLDSRITDFGYGFAWSNYYSLETCGVANWGYDFSNTEQAFRIYPPDGELGVPFSWNGVEAPDPLPDSDQPLGPPISFAYTNESAAPDEIRLFDATGSELTLLESSVLQEKNHFTEVLPAAPLQPGTSYTLSYNSEGKSHSSRFTTDDLNPVEYLLQELNGRIDPNLFDFRPRDFDLQTALEINQKPGKLLLDPGHNSVTSLKYGFTFTLPPGWELGDEQSWQEVQITEDWHNINFFLYNPGMDKTPGRIREGQEPQLPYQIKKEQTIVTDVIQGQLVTYDWEYDNDVIVCYFYLGNYAAVIYGYGATESEMLQVIHSLHANY